MDKQEFLKRLKSGPQDEDAIRRLPSLDLSGRQLGSAILKNPPYLIGGWWKTINLTGSWGHVVVTGFVDRLVMSAPKLCVRLYGAFTHVDARCFRDSRRSGFLELNGDIFKIDFRGNLVKEFELFRGTREIGTDIPAWARIGRVNPCNERVDSLQIHRILAENPKAWRAAIENAERATRWQLNPLEAIPDE
jgi:hypothetical protein